MFSYRFVFSKYWLFWNILNDLALNRTLEEIENFNANLFLF